MEHHTHFFFAVRIPEETKFIMNKHLEKLMKNFPFTRWVHFEDLHITLAFLGGATAEKLRLAEKNVKEKLQGSKPFQLQIHQLGFFGRQDSPRVFFADTLESQELQVIQKTVFTACEDAGFQLETRPFRPHITVARKWQGEEAFQTRNLEVWKNIQPEPLIFEATDVVLYQTHLKKTPKYEAISIFPLK